MSEHSQKEFNCRNNFFWIEGNKFADAISSLSHDTKQQIRHLLKTEDSCKNDLSFAMSEGADFQDWNKVIDFLANDLGVPMSDLLMKHHNSGLSGDFLYNIKSANDVNLYKNIGIDYSQINMTKHADIARSKDYNTLVALKEAGLNFTQIEAVENVSEAFKLLQGATIAEVADIAG
jgi:hypothetical protein